MNRFVFAIKTHGDSTPMLSLLCTADEVQGKKDRQYLIAGVADVDGGESRLDKLCMSGRKLTSDELQSEEVSKVIESFKLRILKNSYYRYDFTV